MLHDRVGEARRGRFFRFDLHAHARFAHRARGGRPNGGELDALGKLRQLARAEKMHPNCETRTDWRK